MNSHSKRAKRALSRVGRLSIASCVRDESSRGPAMVETTPILDYFIAE